MASHVAEGSQRSYIIPIGGLKIKGESLLFCKSLPNYAEVKSAVEHVQAGDLLMLVGLDGRKETIAYLEELKLQI